LVSWYDSALKRGAAASFNADTADFSWPNADSCVCIVAPAACSLVSGCFSTAISWVTMLFTSRPLPMPADEMVAVALLRAMGVPGQCGGRRGRLMLSSALGGRT
jgi:hypothetical protein